MLKRLETKVYGRVQMVLFRDFTKRNAEHFGLTGFVRNENDGTAWVVAEGEEEKLKLLLAKIHRGPMFARVEEVEVEWKEATGNYKDFVIDYS
ncbi:MAG: acylphosphatase [Candidatus Sungbacteria bacterium]|uniref:acylphosphatase n=1 Tax=Candidatus Sungiibacteriota bacterium TaxID=2750080 RepID=A0A931WPJ8_9BACT|nr:acylphosphatase [Candidatus Sungbacteria bacterium]